MVDWSGLDWPWTLEQHKLKLLNRVVTPQLISLQKGSYHGEVSVVRAAVGEMTCSGESGGKSERRGERNVTDVSARGTYMKWWTSCVRGALFVASANRRMGLVDMCDAGGGHNTSSSGGPERRKRTGAAHYMWEETQGLMRARKETRLLIGPLHSARRGPCRLGLRVSLATWAMGGRDSTSGGPMPVHAPLRDVAAADWYLTET